MSNFITLKIVLFWIQPWKEHILLFDLNKHSSQLQVVLYMSCSWAGTTCVPTSSQYIRLSIDTKPHPPPGEHEHIGIPLHYWGVPPSHESTRVLPDQNPYLWSQERGSGHIVNISSDSERVAFPGQKSLLTLKMKLHTRLHRLLGDQVLLGRGVRRAQEGADGNRGKFF